MAVPAVPRIPLKWCHEVLLGPLPSTRAGGEDDYNGIPRCYKLFNGIPYYSTLLNVIPCYSTVFLVIPCYSTSQLLAHNDSRLINPRRAYQLRTVCVAGSHLIGSP